MNAVSQTAHSNKKRPAVRERLIHEEVAANGEITSNHPGNPSIRMRLATASTARGGQLQASD
ncbi:hypothetical protein GCM10008992_32390 [Halorubrum aquaticum]